MQGVLERMRNHLDACPSREIIIDCDSNSGAESVNLTDSPKTAGKKTGSSKVSCNLDAFVVKTSKRDKEKLDEQTARFFLDQICHSDKSKTLSSRHFVIC